MYRRRRTYALLPAPQRKRAVLCLVGAALALGWDWLYIRQVSAPMEALAATRQTLTMTLTDYPTETRFGAKVTVRAEGAAGKARLLRRFAAFAALSRAADDGGRLSAKCLPDSGR